MDVAGEVLNQGIVMLILISVGVLAYKSGLINQKGEKQLSKFLLMVVVPAVLLSSYQQSYKPSLVSGLLIAIGLAFAAHLIGMVISYVLIRGGKPYTSTERFAVIYSNCSFFAIPIISATLGSEGVFYAGAYITVFNVLSWSHGVFMISGQKSFKLLLKIITTPAIIAVALGLVMFFTQIKFPAVVNQALTHISNLNTPLAMIVAGVSIARTGIIKTFLVPRAYYISFLRLILIPALTLLALSALPVDRTIAAATLISAACPSGATVILFANTYGGDSKYASQLVAVTTLLSVVSIPLIMYAANFVF